MNSPILAPAAVLVAWSLIMMFWMAGTRLPALKKIGIDITKNVGGRGADIDPNVPPSVAWKSHNYAHLMEQPTIFYAAIFILALAGAATPLMVTLAWGYTILRIMHSIWQATINKVSIRFVLFLLSSICLVILSIKAVIATI
jgi:hypothetical protein